MFWLGLFIGVISGMTLIIVLAVTHHNREDDIQNDYQLGYKDGREEGYQEGLNDAKWKGGE